MNTIKVMIIEDHEMLLDALKSTAELAQNRDIEIVCTARNEQEALEVLQDYNLDIVVVDMQLPRALGESRDNEAGLRIIKIISAQRSDLKTLAISGVIESPELILNVLRSGAAGYVLKRGSKLEQVFNSIREIYHGKTIYPPEVVQLAISGDTTKLHLTHRERKVWKSIADGLTNREISQKLYISLDTVKRCTSELYSKIEVTNRAQATRRWLEEQYGLVEIEPKKPNTDLYIE